ncbi:MAG TPA: glycerophosphodiester phosphodiesterase family protein [Rhizomicrobium sp.]|nr:glycerophosphodiester phosphodiesterase family protein [Rhizomicrobium sp.]
MWNIAHRGGAGLRPENTLAAFADAVARGCDGAELDVQLTADGKLVVFHDFRLKPELCRGPDGAYVKKPAAKIVELTLAQLETYTIGEPDPASAYAKAHPGLVPAESERVPLLAEVIELAKLSPKPFWLFVELKTSFADRSQSAAPEAVAEETIRVLKDSGYLDRAILVGFDWPGLLHARKIAPAARCWFTTLAQSWFRDGDPPPEDDPPAAPALQALRHWAATGTSPWAGGFDAVNHGGSILKAIKDAGGDGWFPMYRDATQEAVAAARALGLKVGAWTVNGAADMRALAGLDALCTDRPDILAGVLRDAARPS